MSQNVLETIRDIIQEDVGQRGLRTDPSNNFVTVWPHDFEGACQSLALQPNAAVGIITGFYIPHAQPPCGETDGPLGALFLARALVPLGIRVALLTDHFCVRALECGLEACGLDQNVLLCPLPPASEWDTFLKVGWTNFVRDFRLTHLIAVERVGPSHTHESVKAQFTATAETVELFEEEVPPEHRDRCHTMRGLDITANMSPAHLLFERLRRRAPDVTTIGIGDGGNEIGMGKIPWNVVRRNIRGGALVACRISTDYLIVCGISNWGAYGLATGVRLLRAEPHDADLYDLERERELLRIMVEGGPLVDGVSGKPSVTVDGLSFDSYAAPLRRIGELAAAIW
jgi:hypothetical protein